jgi:hypothetical protein
MHAQIPVRLVREIQKQLAEEKPLDEEDDTFARSSPIHDTNALTNANPTPLAEPPNPKTTTPAAAPTKPPKADRAPKLPLGNLGCSQKQRVTGRPSRLQPYGLKEEDTPLKLQQELKEFERFLTVRFPGQQEPRVGAYTATKYLVITRQVGPQNE